MAPRLPKLIRIDEQKQRELEAEREANKPVSANWFRSRLFDMPEYRAGVLLIAEYQSPKEGWNIHRAFVKGGEWIPDEKPLHSGLSKLQVVEKIYRFQDQHAKSRLLPELETAIAQSGLIDGATVDQFALAERIAFDSKSGTAYHVPQGRPLLRGRFKLSDLQELNKPMAGLAPRGWDKGGALKRQQVIADALGDKFPLSWLHDERIVDEFKARNDKRYKVLQSHKEWAKATSVHLFEKLLKKNDLKSLWSMLACGFNVNLCLLGMNTELGPKLGGEKEDSMSYKMAVNPAYRSGLVLYLLYSEKSPHLGISKAYRNIITYAYQKNNPAALSDSLAISPERFLLCLNDDLLRVNIFKPLCRHAATQTHQRELLRSILDADQQFHKLPKGCIKDLIDTAFAEGSGHLLELAIAYGYVKPDEALLERALKAGSGEQCDLLFNKMDIKIPERFYDIEFIKDIASNSSAVCLLIRGRELEETDHVRLIHWAIEHKDDNFLTELLYQAKESDAVLADHNVNSYIAAGIRHDHEGLFRIFGDLGIDLSRKLGGDASFPIVEAAKHASASTVEAIGTCIKDQKDQLNLALEEALKSRRIPNAMALASCLGAWSSDAMLYAKQNDMPEVAGILSARGQAKLGGGRNIGARRLG